MVDLVCEREHPSKASCFFGPRPMLRVSTNHHLPLGDCFLDVAVDSICIFNLICVSC